MKRRSFITNSGQLGLMLLLAPHLISCKEKGKVGADMIQEAMNHLDFVVPANAAHSITHVGGNIFTFEERGGTIGFYADKNGVAVIDTQFPDQSNTLIDAIKSKVERPIDLLINTHHHGDHTAGNIAYKGLVTDHVAHINSLKNQQRVATERGTEDVQKYPSTMFTDEWRGNVGDETIIMRYFGAGHTDGDAVTTFEQSNIVHMGDLVFNRRFPYIDKSAGANIENWIKVLDETLKHHTADTKYIFGHADNGFPVQGKSEDIRAFQNYLEKLLAFGEQVKKEGKSLEEAKESTRVIPGAPEWKGDGIGRSLDAMYEELGI